MLFYSNVAGAGKYTHEGGYTSCVECSSICLTSYGVHTKTGSIVDVTSPPDWLGLVRELWKKKKISPKLLQESYTDESRNNNSYTDELTSEETGLERIW